MTDQTQQKDRFDPDFCESQCPVCTRARKRNRFARFLQRIETLVTFGGCPWGRARQHKYGVKPRIIAARQEMASVDLPLSLSPGDPGRVDLSSRRIRLNGAEQPLDIHR